MKIHGPLFFLMLLCLAVPAFCAELNYVEYYIDTDPGQGNGYGFNILSDAYGSYTYFSNLLLFDLPYGQHVLYTRYRDTQGRYSGAKGRNFYVAAKPNLVAAEEFIDTDPGEGSAQAKDVTDSADATSYQAHSHSLPQGASHVFYARYQCEDGTWSIPKGKRFNLAPSQTLINAEYFLEPDPGLGNGTAMDIADVATETYDYRDAVAPSGLGLKTLGVRYQSANGGWSAPNRTRINVLPVSSSGLIHIGGAEVYLDSDPGPGNGIAMTAVDGDFDELEEQAFAVIAFNDSSDFGNHVVCIRIRDASGTWTNVVCDTVSVPVRLVIQGVKTAVPPAFLDVRLLWNTQDDAVYYEVHYDSVSGGPFISYATVFAPDTTYSAPLDTSKAVQFYHIVPVSADILAGEPGTPHRSQIR